MRSVPQSTNFRVMSKRTSLQHQHRRRYGEKHQRAKYSDKRVTAALDLLDSGLSQRQAAARLGIPRTTLQAWAAGLTRAVRTGGDDA